MRRTRIWHALFGLFMGTAVPGCIFLLDYDDLQKGGGGSGGTSADSVAPIELKDAALAIALALCDRVTTCAGPALPLLLFDDDCVQVTKQQLNDQLFSGMATLDPITFEYHGDRTPQCVDEIRAAPCTETKAWSAACDAAFEGKVGQGGECTHPGECTPGLYCKAQQCPGSCEPRFGEGSECIPGECREDLRCETINGKGVCVKLKATAETCGGGALPLCELGLYCLGSNPQTGTTGQCRNVADVFTSAEGLACNWKAPFCVGGLYCEIDSQLEVANGTLAGTCIRQLAPGDNCRLAIPDPCPKDYYCRPNAFVPPDKASVEGSCQKLPGPQSPCAQDAIFKPHCASGSTCVNPTTLDPGECQAVVPLDIACITNEGCYSGYCGPSGKCAPPNFCVK